MRGEMAMSSLIDPNTTIGLVSLTVSNLDRSLAYYQQNIGLQLRERNGGTATLGAGERNLLKLQELPGARLVRRATGLYHFALRVPSRLELARTLHHLIETETPIDGASDHFVSEALYLSDPDGHGLEIYRDRPRSDWYDAQGNFHMSTDPFDLHGVLGELKNGNQPWPGLHPETVMGHVHLQVDDVAQARRFYTETLGFEHMADYPMASFVSAGGYHHHIGMNSWMGAGAPPPPENAARLLFYEIYLPDKVSLAGVLERLKKAAIPLSEQETGWLVRDPAQNSILLRVG
jgi:catechol 2,3-dioxygenase